MNCLYRSKINYLLLEKPLAHTPEEALITFEKLILSRKIFRIGYTFRYTEWGSQLRRILIGKEKFEKLTLHWSFMAHHYKNNLQNWKRFHSVGGGAIRFYGIHIISLLAEIGYSYITVSNAYSSKVDEIEKWKATFTGINLPTCEVIVDSKSNIDEFSIKLISKAIINSNNYYFKNLSDPFEPININNSSNEFDKRTLILTQLCSSLWKENENKYKWYEKTLRLWQLSEYRMKYNNF